jgi:PmbA protein
MEESELENLWKVALARGAEAAEAYWLREDLTLVDIKEGRVEVLSRGQQAGVGLRVFRDRRMGFSFRSHDQQWSPSDLAESSLAAALQSHPDPYLDLPSAPFLDYPRVEAYDPALARLDLADRLDFARRMERSARAIDPRITKVRHCLYQDSCFSVMISNSRGLKARGEGTKCSASLLCVAEEEGWSETGWDLQCSSFFSDLEAERIGEQAAEQALSMLRAKPLPTGRVDAIFSPAAASEFLETLAPALMAEAVQKGKSLFAGRRGERVASSVLTLVDDGLLPHGYRSFPFDDEGWPCQRSILMEAGVLQDYLYDLHAAAKEGRESTGNARRGGYQYPPQIAATNFFILPGKRDQQALVEEMGRGALVLSLMGMHTADPVSGDFSVGAEGIWIEGGGRHRPFRGVIMAGNIREWLQAVEEVGSDLRFFGPSGSPSLLIREIQVAGS